MFNSDSGGPRFNKFGMLHSQELLTTIFYWVSTPEGFR